MNNRTELPKKEFRWASDVLEQRVEIIQHRCDGTNEVGIYQEWHPVIVNGNKIFKSYEKRKTKD